MKKKAAKKVPAAETRRLARIRELAGQHRRAQRTFERAVRAAHERGISVRKIAAAAGISTMSVWRLARPGAGQPGLDAKDIRLPHRIDKPKKAGK